MSHVPAFVEATGGATHMPAFVNAGGGAGASAYWSGMFPAGTYWDGHFPEAAGSGGVVHPHMPAFTNATQGP